MSHEESNSTPDPIKGHLNGEEVQPTQEADINQDALSHVNGADVSLDLEGSEATQDTETKEELVRTKGVESHGYRGKVEVYRVTPNEGKPFTRVKGEDDGNHPQYEESIRDGTLSGLRTVRAVHRATRRVRGELKRVATEY